MRVIVHCGVVAALLLSMALAAPQGDHEGHDHGPHTAEHHHHLHHGEDEPHPQHEGQHSQMLSQPNADFAFTLYKKLSALPQFQSKNIFFSPLSISMALSMLALGAKGDTFSQLYQALGYAEMTPETVNEAYEHIFHMLGHNQEHMQLDASNAVAVMEEAKVIDKFLEDAKHYYESEAISVDFSKPDVAVQEINKYIAKNTNNTINDMVKEVNPATVMMLINCIYFRGEWMEYFDLEETKKGDFQVDVNTKASVDMMQNNGFYEFYEDKENFTTVLRLPYKGSASMIIVMPDEGKMKEVEDSICRHHLKHWMHAMESSNLIVHMPKYSISGKFSLKDTLESMGVVSAFSHTADFTGMTDQKVKVSEVEHKAVLNVDEKGTEAAAATTVEIVLMSAPVQPKTLKIDRPFLVFITDYNTKSILFMGKILNPAAE
ncbi:alpha-1-antitrypsin homolog [Alosa sapidissima]|uniref:alpha-1-antitrypsin homolog n=1 Tax=Alosa sapidissima TaxID=34773 RepID=UPI001C081F94|nr:alpha-1-antitrypsin homolog [Alosa sapidissima]